MKRIALSFIAVLAVLGVVGCADTSRPVPPEPSPVPPEPSCNAATSICSPDQLFETRLRAQCAFEFICCEDSEREYPVGLSNAPDEGTCIEQGLEVGGSLAVLGQRAKVAVDAGNAVFDGEFAEECLRPLLDAGQECTYDYLRSDHDHVCNAGFARAFVDGTIEDGSACNDSLECADEGDCVPDEGGGNVSTTAGRCLAHAGEGDDCSERACRTGLSCAFGDSEPKCKKTVLKKGGEYCGADSDCESSHCVGAETSHCDDGSPCDSGKGCGDGWCHTSFNDVCAYAETDPEIRFCNGRD